MKKLPLLCLFVGLASLLPAQMSGRTFEFGIDVEAGFANNYMDFKKLFSNETLEIDLNALPLNGLSSAAIGDAGLFFNFRVKQFTFGFFTGMDGFFTGGLSGEVVKLLSRGNADMRNFSGEILLGGSLFFDMGLNASMDFKGWKFGAVPSLYIPLFYMPKPLIRLNLNTADTLSVDMSMRVNVYTPYSLENSHEDIQISGNIFNASGFDLSLFAEYALLPVLDLGGIMTHIPIVPSRMTYGMHFIADFAFPQGSGEEIGESFIDALVKDQLSDIEGNTFYLDADSLYVFRPLRFDVFARYKPLKTEFFTLTPMIGFSCLTVYGYDKVCFNAGLTGRLNLMDLFMVALSTGYSERLWRHKLGIGLNLRAFEVDLEAGLMSQDFVGSFNFNGLSLALGLRFGY